MTSAFMEGLGQYGAIGIMLVVCLWALYQMNKDLKEVYEARTRDGREVVTTLLKLVDDSHKAAQDMRKSIDENTVATKELREQTRELRTTLERMEAEAIDERLHRGGPDVNQVGRPASKSRIG